MPSRRDLLATLGAGAVVGVAGCTGRRCSPVAPVGIDWPQPGGGAGNRAAVPDHSLPARVGERWRVSIAPEDPGLLAFAGGVVVDGRVVTAGRTRDGGFHGSVGLRDGDPGTWYVTNRTIAAPPVVVDGGTVLVHQTDTGSTLHLSDDGVEGWTQPLDGSGPPTPRAVDGTLLCGDAGGLLSIDAGPGERRWHREFGDEREGGAVTFSPVADDRRVYVTVTSSSDRGIYALNRRDGETEWLVEGPRASRAPVRVGSLLLVPTEYELLAFDATTGDREWSTPTPANRRTFRSPAGTESGLVVSDGTVLHRLDPGTGELGWSVDAETVGRPIVVGDSVVVSADGAVVAFELDDGSERWRLDRTSLVAPLANGVVVRREDELIACTACEN
ncbi:PQQ-binding-like beta-propeller repeat protein [Halolamina sediminis]|jgi:outer membrane protein assembly factor BamB|uniref:PQQ-binding-like beta-propeller repeat protein n=1 Tax=Halolamina sediminis TaxID=1480675 RepID=UPI0006B541FA|nr:PQQ-binding-like beta-propeller repeat protein [Halolamina sediminis]